MVAMIDQVDEVDQIEQVERLERRRRPGRAGMVLAVWLAPSGLCLALVTAVYLHYRIPAPAPVAEPTRSAMLRGFRAALESGPDDAMRALDAGHPDLERALPHGGPIVARVWFRGRELARVSGHGARLGEAAAAALRELARDPRIRRATPTQKHESRIQVDIVLDRGPLAPGIDLARALGLHPGLEGLAVVATTHGPERARRQALLLPDELTYQRLHGTARPLSFIPDFTIGLHITRADAILASRTGLGARAYRAGERRYARVRSDSFIEPPPAGRDSQPAIGLIRGLPPPPPVTASELRRAALRAGRYLANHLAPSGRYIYRRDLTSGRGTDPAGAGPYSIPRHAGTTYFLAELYRLTGEDWLREPIERAFAHLETLIRDGGCSGSLPGGAEFSCVVDRGQKTTDLGATALTVVALAEYQRATRDPRYLALAGRLGEWILWMQRRDGSFAHVYDVARAQKDERAHKLYYSGEAALALARMHAITGEERYRDAAERALDHLVAWYDFFLGGFFFGEEHWTCIAAEAAHPAVAKLDYVELCHDLAGFLRRQQPRPGEFVDQADYVGSYNATAVLVPQNTPAGSKTEAMISAYQLGLHHGRRDPAILEQIRLALRYLLGQQIDERGDFAVAPDARAIGAVPGTPVDRTVRIDYVQHVGSAMIRAAALLE